MTAANITPDLERTTPPSEQVVFLHIGAFKTGTSFLQSVLLRNRDELASHGVCYPTDHTNWGLQTRATRDLLGAKRSINDETEGAWERMIAEVRLSGAPRAVISVERLSTATVDQARETIASLAPSDVHVILTLRDLARVLPSDWQSKIKQGRTWPFHEYVAAAQQVRSITNPFWRHHDATRIVTTWLAAVAHDHLHVVTVPPSGAPPERLWERFCGVLGIGARGYNITQNSKSNFSLSYSDTEFLRKINIGVLGGLDKLERKRWMTKYVANTVLRPGAASVSSADRPNLTDEEYRWARSEAERIVAELEPLHLQIAGDLSDLLPAQRSPVASPEGPRNPVPDRAADIAAVLVQAVARVHVGGSPAIWDRFEPSVNIHEIARRTRQPSRRERARRRRAERRATSAAEPATSDRSTGRERRRARRGARTKDSGTRAVTVHGSEASHGGSE